MAVAEVFKIERLGALTAVTNVNELVVPPPPVTATVFVTDAGAFSDTFTLIVMNGAEAPVAMTALVLHVTTWAAAIQVQPEPLALINVTFGLSVSMTVITPELEAVPILMTWTMYTPGIPAVKFAGEGVFDMDRFGGAPPLPAITEKLVPAPFTKYAEFCDGGALVLKTRV